MIRSEFPDRYGPDLDVEFKSRVHSALAPGMSILDVGSGRSPTVPAEQRPAGSRYVGLDISRSELELAPAGSYDSLVVADLVDAVPDLVDSFDLIVSFQVLEHVRPLDRAVENMHRYLRPGGRLVAQFSGTFSLFGVANRLIPHRAARYVLRQLLQRDPQTVFPAHYHHCWYGALERMLAEWTSVEIVPIWRGASYLDFSRPLQAAYLHYEEWARRSDRRNLAAYYIVDAVC